MDEYEEYLDQLVVEVEGKVGTMPTCLRNPLRNEPISSPFAMSSVDEGLEEAKTARSSDEYEGGGLLKRNTFTSNCEGANGEEGGYSKGGLEDEGSVRWQDQFSSFERSLQTLRDSMSELRSLDIDLARQLLSVNDSIEELKWINENYELYDSKDSLIINSKSLVHYDSREQLHKRWVSERKLLATSSTSLNNSMSNLNLSKELRDFSTHLNRLNQNNNSNGPDFDGQHKKPTHVLEPDSFSLVAEEFEYHPRSMSTSCTEKSSAHHGAFSPLRCHRPASSTALVEMDYGPTTSTPKTDHAETKNDEEANHTSNVDASSLDSSQISRVRVGSYGSQVRWHYKQTSEEELYF